MSTQALVGETEPEVKKTIINDFSIQVATINGSGSQSSNSILMRSIFQMGIPVSGKWEWGSGSSHVTAMAGGVRVPALVGLVDLAPTLYELTGVEPPRPPSGRSLAPYLLSPELRLGDEAYGEALDRENFRTLLREQDGTVYQIVLVERDNVVSQVTELQAKARMYLG